MGLLKSIGKGIKKVGKAVGKVASGASKVVGAIPGVGSLVAPALAVGGSVLQGKNMKSHLKAGAQAALPIVGGKVLNAVSGKLPGALKGALGGLGGKSPIGKLPLPVPGLPAGVKLPSFAPQLSLPKLGAQAASGLMGAAGGSRFGVAGDLARQALSGGKALTLRNVIGNAGGGAPSRIATPPFNPGGQSFGPASGDPSGGRGGLGGFIRDNVMGGKPITLRNVLGGAASGVGGAIKSGVEYARDNPDAILGGASVMAGALAAKQASDLRKRALSTTDERYRERAPLRQKALAGLTNSQRPDLSSIYADPGNPYARRGAQ